jgi:hypothetical protein
MSDGRRDGTGGLTAWWREGPAIAPPPPPPGHGPRVGSRTEGRWARRRSLLWLLVVYVLLAGPIVGWYHTRLAIALFAVAMVPCWLLVVWRSPPKSVAVGEDWLRVRTTRSDRWVQTDQLVKAEVWFNWATRKLILEDRDGRRLIVDLADLNPVMLEAFRAAMRRSQAAGLRLNRVTESTLQLQ